MKRRKIVLLFVSASLILNTVIINAAFSQDKLAAPSILNNLTGTQSSEDINDIKLLMQAFLMGAARGRTDTTIKGLINYVAEHRSSMSRDVNFFVNEELKLPASLELQSGRHCIMFRTNKGADRPENVRTYYVVFSFDRDLSDGFPIDIYTQAKWKELDEIKDQKISPRRRQYEPRWERAIREERIYPILRVAKGLVPKERFYLSRITAEVVLALESAGLCGKGKSFKDEIDRVAVETICRKLTAIAAAYNVKFVHVTGEGEKDRGERKGALLTALGAREVIGSENSTVTIYIGTDPMDGTTNFSLFEDGKEGRSNSVFVAGEGIIPVPDDVRAFALTYNDRGKGIEFDFSRIAKYEKEIGVEGKISLEEALVRFVKEYAEKMEMSLRNIVVYTMSSHQLDGDNELKAPDRHLKAYNELKKLGVKLEPFNHVSTVSQAFAGMYPGHIYFGAAGSTESFFTAQGLKNLADHGAKSYLQIVSDNIGYDVELGEEGPLGRYYDVRVDKDRNDMANRFKFSTKNVNALYNAMNSRINKSYFSKSDIDAILQGEKVFTLGDLPAVDFYLTFALPTSYEFTSGESREIIFKDKGIVRNNDGSRTLRTLIMKPDGAFIAEETFVERKEDDEKALKNNELLSELGLEELGDGSGRVRRSGLYVPPELTYDLMVIPHGETKANVNEVILNNHAEIEELTGLNSMGWAQSWRGSTAFWNEYGERIKKSPNDFIFVTSPLRRAVQTTLYYIQSSEFNNTEVAFTPDEGAREINFGSWHGKVLEDLSPSERAAVLAYRNGNAFIKAEDGESQVEFIKRVKDWLLNKNEGWKGKTVVLSGHGTFLHALDVILQNKTNETDYINLALPPAGLNRGYAQYVYCAGMVNFAKEIGVQIAPPVKNYTIFTSFKRGDYEKDLREYGSRFNLEFLTEKTVEDIARVINTAITTGLSPDKIALSPRDIIVQIPANLIGENDISPFVKLEEQGVKFMRIDTEGLNNIKDEDKRAGYRKGIYAMMLLAREIGPSTTEDSKLCRLLRFFIRAHFGGEGKDRSVTVDKYIDAFIRNRSLEVINIMLFWKPIERNEVPDPAVISAVLMSA